MDDKQIQDMNDVITAKEKIKESAMFVMSKLNEYIKLHNEIAAKQGSILSFLRNLFGKPVPFSEFVLKTKKLEKEFKEIPKSLNSIKQSLVGRISNDESAFLDCLLEYADALLITVATLRKRQEVFLEKKNEYKNVRLNIAAAKEIEKRYQNTINNYKKIGDRLTEQNHVIF